MGKRATALAVAALYATQAACTWIALEGRLLTDVLADYEAAGYVFLYSSDLVKRDTRLTLDAAADQPAERLRLALQAIDLTLTTTPGSTALRIVQGEAQQTSKAPIRNQSAPRIEELLVTSRYILKKSVAGTQHTLDADELNAIPELGDDALRAANHLPGVSTIGVSAKPHIRGGLQDEMLVLFNNVELLEPFHLKDFQSVFSGFNPSLIKSIDVYTGGFPARYGDRMSGVVEIFPSDRPEGLGGELTLSLLTSAAAMYSTIADQGDWAVSARRGNLDLVTKQVNPTLGSPSYSDFYAQIRGDVGPRTDLEAGAIYYDDDIVLHDLTDLTGEIAQSRYRNTYGWLQMHRDWSDTVNSSTVLSYGSIKHDREGYLNDPEPEEGSGVLTDERSFELWSLTHHTIIDASPTLAFEAGGRLSYQRGRYDHLSVLEQDDFGELISPSGSFYRGLHTDISGYSGGVYASSTFTPVRDLMLQLGVRWDFQTYINQQSVDQISPRLSARWKLGEQTDLRLALGRFQQPQGIHELQISDGVEQFQPAQFADHVVLGYNHTFGETGLSAHIEAFHKRFHDPKFRFENLFNPMVLLPELGFDRVKIEPDKARANGTEWTLRYQPDRNLHLWLSYTHSKAEDYIAGRWEARRWNQSDSISSGMIWNSGPWSLSATYLWHSGWQTTGLPAFLDIDAPPSLARNNDRLPHYASLDVRVSHTWEFSNQSLILFAEVTNLFNRKNVGGIEYELLETEVEGQYTTVAEDVELLPLVPSIGITWQFH